MTIEIRLNGELRKTEAGKLDALLDRFHLPTQRIAVELNSRVVRKTDWPETAIRDGDVIEVIHFVGGG